MYINNGRQNADGSVSQCFPAGQGVTDQPISCCSWQSTFTCCDLIDCCLHYTQFDGLPHASYPVKVLTQFGNMWPKPRGSEWRASPVMPMTVPSLPSISVPCRPMAMAMMPLCARKGRTIHSHDVIQWTKNVMLFSVKKSHLISQKLFCLHRSRTTKPFSTASRIPSPTTSSPV